MLITCMGLIVDMFGEHPKFTDALNSCARWLKDHQYLLDLNPTFESNGRTYFKVIDHKFNDDGQFLILCRMYDGSTKVGVDRAWYEK